MNFTLDDGQTAVRDLASRILGDRSTHERLTELEASGDRLDRDTWAELAKAGLVGIAVAEDAGGGGLGFLEAALVAEEVGRTTALVPYMATVAAALAVDRFAVVEVRERILRGVCDGAVVLSVALAETGADPRAPLAAVDGDGLNGTAHCVPWAGHADAVVVAAADGLYLVEGLASEPLVTTSGVPEGHVSLGGASATRIGDADAVAWVEARYTGLLCAAMAGACQRAVALTAQYTKTREQFDKPIASFQAVGHRAADAYIDTEAVRLTALQAAWRLAEGLPADREVAIAKFWAADGGQRVVHAAQHLHGGFGVDRDYALHRTFLWAKHLELTLGGATPQLLRLGRQLAAPSRKLS